MKDFCKLAQKATTKNVTGKIKSDVEGAITLLLNAMMDNGSPMHPGCASKMLCEHVTDGDSGVDLGDWEITVRRVR